MPPSDWVRQMPELTYGEAFRQSPHLPEGRVQGANLSMKERPLSTLSLPNPAPFSAETDPPGSTFTDLLRDPLRRKTTEAIIEVIRTGGESHR